MDTLASVIYGLFSQAYREHPAPPLMEKLRHFLRQSKPEQPLGPFVAFLSQLFQFCFADGQHGNFRAGKDRIQRNQNHL
jgi:hypothetical protein